MRKNTTTSIPKLRNPPIIKHGPKFLSAPVIHIGGPGDPPEGFLGHRNSAIEWPPYWACATIFKNPPNPRQGPFDGGWPDWTYQNPTAAGAGLMGSVVDFVIYPPGRAGKPIAIRLQTEHFHLFVDQAKQTYDEIQRVNLQQYSDVVDIYDYQFMHDKTGQAIIVLIKQAIGLIERPNPLTAGTALRTTRVERSFKP